MPVGYSGTPLYKKLGITDESRLLLIHAPDNYQSLLDTQKVPKAPGKNETPDIIHLFVKTKAEMEKSLQNILPLAKSNPAISIWVSWYKKSAGIPTDITEDSIRNWALKNGLVDVKVCAVSDQWSGLKLVVPKAKR
ncbi:MAG: hypothetical protein ACHQEM_08065 [Chitinophagales bacterium]